MQNNQSTYHYNEVLDDNLVLWKYMDVSKFLSIITRNALFFSRIDRFNDNHEGTFTKGSIEHYMKESRIKINEEDINHFENNSQYLYVNCWFASDVESETLWNRYGSKNGSLAIKSNIKLIKSQYPENFCAKGEDTVNNLLKFQRICKVKYIDYKTEHPDITEFISPACFKKREYNLENEVRIIHWVRHLNNDRPIDETGLYLPANINELVDLIYISPHSPSYLEDAINDILKKFNFNFKCEKSTLTKQPEYGLNK
ncbi:MAG: hypothetical protein JXR69_05480 [Candidatus Delongbacteria bacterium]|nr:hypothetical protein [Candidatus Delongbacteria bacterium]